VLKRQYRTRGDTLIEVLFAISIFSLIAVGGLTIMNQGTAASQRALEITLVRQQMDSQAAALRFLNNSYVAAYRAGAVYDASTPAGQWSLMIDSIKSTGATAASDFGGTSCPKTLPTGSFIIDPLSARFMNPTSGVFKPAATYSQLIFSQTSGQSVLTDAEGIWVEAVRSINSADANQANIGYIDFHIRACWESLGQSLPVTLGTIVRLYEPR
jgi:prepilin-type N-terminal cleavage/methylation domain-containing protein